MSVDIVKIENTEMQIKEYDGQRVVTFKDIDEVHKRIDGSSRKAFQNNKKHFIPEVDYYVVTRENSNGNIFPIEKIPPKGVTLLTESGYLMIVKTFTDDLSWTVQRQLVNSYFRVKEEPRVKIPSPESKHIFRTSNTPIPKNPSWYQRNRRRMQKICNNQNITLSELYHHILTRLGEEFDLDSAAVIYCSELGSMPKYPADIINYFTDLSALADNYLDKVEVIIWGHKV